MRYSVEKITKETLSQAESVLFQFWCWRRKANYNFRFSQLMPFPVFFTVVFEMWLFPEKWILGLDLPLFSRDALPLPVVAVIWALPARTLLADADDVLERCWSPWLHCCHCSCCWALGDLCGRGHLWLPRAVMLLCTTASRMCCR